MNTTSIPLTNDELISLKKDLRMAYFTGSIIGIMAVLILFFIILALNNKINAEFIGLCLLVTAVTWYLILFFTKDSRLEIANGLKNVTTYQILEKRSFEDDEPGLGGYVIKYHLITSEKRFSVEKILYDSANENDYLIEHSTPLTGKTLKLEIKKNTEA